MKPKMYGHDGDQTCLYNVYLWPDGLEVHDELEVIWRDNYPVVCFSLTLADFVEGVLHFYDIPILHLLQNHGNYRVFVQGEMCALARLLTKEQVMIGLHNAWKLLRACYGDILEMEYVQPDILRISHTGLRNLRVEELARDVLGDDFLKSLQTEFEWLDTDNKRENGLDENMIKVKSKLQNDCADKRAAGTTSEALISENQRLKEELSRLRSEVGLLRFELAKARKVPYSPDIQEDIPESNVTTTSGIEREQKVQDYLAQRKKNNIFIHDAILDILSYFSGESLPEAELFKILARELNTDDDSVRTLLRAFPYFCREGDGWNFNPDMHNNLLTCLAECFPVEPAPALVATAKEVNKQADYIDWAVSKWDLLKRGGKRALLLYLIDHSIELCSNKVNRELLWEMDALAAAVYRENIFSTEQCLWMAEQFVWRGCYQFATTLYYKEGGKHPACKLAYLIHIVSKGQTDYKVGEFFAILLQANLAEYLPQCHEIVLEDLLKVSLILGYESDLWQLFNNQFDRIATSDVLKVLRKCVQEGRLQNNDLTSLSKETKLDKLFLDALYLYVPETLTGDFKNDLNNTHRDLNIYNENISKSSDCWQVRDILHFCLTDVPVLHVLPALKETPKMLIFVAPLFHSRITVKNLRTKANLTAGKAKQIIETGVSLGFLKQKSDYYSLTKDGADLQQVEEEHKWRLLLKIMVKHAVFQRSIKKLVVEGKVSEQDVLSIIDGLTPGNKSWYKLPYIWLRDVLLEVDVIQAHDGLIKLKSGIME